MITDAGGGYSRWKNNVLVRWREDQTRDNWGAILCRKRPGGADPDEPWMFHMLVAEGVTTEKISCETDRAGFIGRGHTLADPQAMRESRLSGTQGSVLDPIVAIRCPLSLKPGQSVTVYYLFGVGDSRQACLVLMKKYGNGSRIDDTFRRGQSSLWGFAISGDLPIVLLQLDAIPDLDLLRQLLQAHAYWRRQGLSIDLVICASPNIEAGQAAQDAVLALVASEHQTEQLNQPAGVFVRMLPALTPEDRILLQAVARIVIDQSAGSLADQCARRSAARGKALVATTGATPSQHDTANICAATTPVLGLANGLGGFTPDGSEYVITLGAGQCTPTPWVDILANPDFGTLVSESGCASTWSDNAHEFLLTPWSNDPVGDSTGEAIYIRDDDTYSCWSPVPWPCRGPGQYICHHGFGYSRYTHDQDGITSEMQVYVAIDAPIKFVVLKLHNHSGRTRLLSITGYVEWVLGDLRPRNMMQICTQLDSASGTVSASNAYSMEFGSRLVFFSASDATSTLSADRTGFIGRHGAPESPAAMRQPELDGRTGATLDPCGAIRIPFELAAGQEREVIFRLGAAHDQAAMQSLTERYACAAAVHTALAQVTDYWQRTLGVVQVDTPDQSLNFLAMWLALATSRYINTTGDTKVLDTSLHFLTGRPLKPEEASYYELPGVSTDSATLYEHCVRAIRHGLGLGKHGLPLMGTGDWNDGMNKVGAQGKGESTWLAFFLHYVIEQFMPLAQARGDTTFALECEQHCALLRSSIERSAWDGSWFRRAYFDNGTPLGSVENTECQIDSIAQSWAVLSAAADPRHARLAMQAVDAGRGSWTWYSGSAGWLYRLIVESILGLRRRANTLAIDACVPPGWRSFDIHYRYGNSNYQIHVNLHEGKQAGATQLSVDGIVQASTLIALIDDGREHDVQMQITVLPAGVQTSTVAQEVRQ
ncbi:hypothetical protein H0A66_01525 [Alcaligenaceae bacterium]|nr:hypothetical protein [Alcaligenaceae bacterium]